MNKHPVVARRSFVVRFVGFGLLLALLAACSGSGVAPAPPDAIASQTDVAEQTTAHIPATPVPEPTPSEAAEVGATQFPPAGVANSTTATQSDPGTVTGTPEAETATAAPLETAATTPNNLASPELLDAIVLPRRDQVQLAYEYGRSDDTDRVARTEPLPDQVGSQTTFWLAELPDGPYYTVTATLHFALDHVLMYVEDGVEFDQAALERSAREFNDRIYPRNRELFGEEWTPGVDGDPRITILNARISGAGGYFWSPDEVPREADPYSNQREMFYINIGSFPFGSEAYSATLAHEFQHMIHWRQARETASWFNEGLSELAMELNGYSSSGFEGTYISMPDLQLNNWSQDSALDIAHYGAGSLFLAYFYQQYQDTVDLAALVRGGAGTRLELFAKQASALRAEINSFDQIFSDWTIANLVNDPRLDGGRWSYDALPAVVQPEKYEGGELHSDVAQYGVDYVELASEGRDRVFEFDGADDIGLVATEPQGSVSWWSNRGDDVISALTGRFDLTHVQSAALEFRLWYDIEQDYDYGFVSVSTDEGQTWQTLKGRYTTDENPHGANYGHGYTGRSGDSASEWVDESIDLTPFVGGEVLIRFSVITDARLNGPGMLVDNIRIPELEVLDDVEAGAGIWEASGWVRTDNQLPQRWQLHIVRFAENGANEPPGVEPIVVDQEGRARIEVEQGQRAVLIVAATTRHTSERAGYVLAELESQ